MESTINIHQSMKLRKSCFLLIGIFCLVASSAHAQERDSLRIGLSIRDEVTNARIVGAKAYILRSDSTLINSSKSNSSSYAYISIIRNKALKSCIVKVTYPNYVTKYENISLKYTSKKDTYYIPLIYIKRQYSFTDQLLNEVSVTATKVKMYYRGDTLVYNADAFNVANGSMLDALIRQMPGTELTKQGEIFVNGRKVDNLLLNGKDFFRGKNQLMLENLPYYTVQQIKVYEQTTDKAMALQDKYAKKDFVMDVNLKKEYTTGYMANVEIGAGTEDGYLMRLFGLRFTDTSRLAIIGGANNLNMHDYSVRGDVDDRDSREGRTYSNLLTAEMRTEKKNSKNVMTVALSRKKTEQGTDEFQESLHDASSTFSTSQNASTNRNLGVSLNNQYTLKLPFWMQATTDLRFNSKKDDANTLYYESGTDTRQQGMAVLDSLFGMGVALNTPSMISARKRWTNANIKDYSASQDLSISKNLFNTDIIDFNANVDYTKSYNEMDRFNRYLTWGSGVSQTDITEAIDHPNTHFGAKADLAFKNTRLLYDTELRYYAGYSFMRDKERESITDDSTLVVDAENSFDKRMTENKYSMGFDYNYDHWIRPKHINTKLKIKLPFSFILRQTSYSRYTVDTCLKQKPVFFEPSVDFNYYKERSNGMEDWGIFVNTSLQRELPEATQLITLPLTSDRTNIYQGNAHLKSPTLWKTKVNWTYHIKGGDWDYLRQEVIFNQYFNRIISTYRYDNGVYIHTADNINGTWDLNFNTYFRHGLKYKEKDYRYWWKVLSSFRRMKNFIADGATGEPQQVDNNELHVEIPFGLSGPITKNITAEWELLADWRKSLNDNSYSTDHEVWQLGTNLSLTAKLLWGIDLESEWNVTKRYGYLENDLNKLTCEWNMVLSKSVFKNKINLKLKAVDILNQYKSVAYTVNEYGTLETHALSLPSYVLFSMTYQLNLQPKKR